MKSSVVASHPPGRFDCCAPASRVVQWCTVAACAMALAGCAGQPSRGVDGPSGGRYFDPILGVWASPRLIGDGQAVPRGGGGYLVGRPYTIGGRTFVPNPNPQGYVSVGTASWYGDAFHGRRTANGEIFDKGSISAAHPTLPLPSYVRVTNLKNGRSMIVRVNDRGPYHGGRVMDVSQRVAEALSFKGEGTARIRVEYVGRASLAGSDDSKLLASLRTDGGAARLDGMVEPVHVADEAIPTAPDAPTPLPTLPRVASAPTFRRGHLVARLVETTTPIDGVAPPQPARSFRHRFWPAAIARPLPPAAEPTRAVASFGLRRGGSTLDPYYRPLAAASHADPRPSISFTAQPRRPMSPLDGKPVEGASAPGDDTH